MITSYNKDNLKSYLTKKTGYEVLSIRTIDNFPMPADMDFKILGNEGPSMKVESICSNITNKTFLWTETVYFTDFIKFIRMKKLHKINKSTN